MPGDTQWNMAESGVRQGAGHTAPATAEQSDTIATYLQKSKCALSQIAAVCFDSGGSCS